VVLDVGPSAIYAQLVLILRAIGVFLIVLGVAEFFTFRYLARSKTNIARRLPLLTMNSVLNVVVGVVLTAVSL
jgi:hypothetical protein